MELELRIKIENESDAQDFLREANRLDIVKDVRLETRKVEGAMGPEEYIGYVQLILVGLDVIGKLLPLLTEIKRLFDKQKKVFVIVNGKVIELDVTGLSEEERVEKLKELARRAVEESSAQKLPNGDASD